VAINPCICGKKSSVYLRQKIIRASVANQIINKHYS